MKGFIISFLCLFIFIKGFSQDTLLVQDTVILDSIPYLYKRGHQRMITNQLPEALADLKRAHDLGLKNHPLLHNLGSISYRLGNYDEALIYFNEAVDLYPDESESFNDRGQVHLLKDDFEEAIADFEEAIRLKEFWDTPYVNLGILYKRHKLYDKAEHYLIKAIELDHNDLNAILNLASAKVEQDHLEEAIVLLNDAIDHHPEVIDLFLFRASIYTNQNKLDAACEDLKHARDMGAEINSNDYLHVCPH